jgi:hypothetical protein
MHPFPERHSQFLLLRAWTSWTWRSVVGPLFDSAYDWNHYGGPVFDVVGKRLLSIILQHILHHGQKHRNQRLHCFQTLCRCSSRVTRRPNNKQEALLPHLPCKKKGALAARE